MEYSADGTSGTGVELAEAHADEREAIRQLLARANEAYRSVLPAASFDPYLALVLDLESRADVGSLLVARVDGRAVGAVTFFADATAEGWGGPEGVSGLRAMAVDPARRRQGIGTALVGACVERARGAGARALTLHSADWLRDAIRLYERCGFVREPARDQPASDLMRVPQEADFVALAYRLDLEEQHP